MAELHMAELHVVLDLSVMVKQDRVSRQALLRLESESLVQDPPMRFTFTAREWPFSWPTPVVVPRTKDSLQDQFPSAHFHMVVVDPSTLGGLRFEDCE